MGNKKGFNNYEIRGDVTAIFLENRKGEKFETLIDTEDLERIKALGYHWSPQWLNDPKDYYVMASVYQGYENGVLKNNKTYKLHSVIMNTKYRETVDHINHNSLDNRKENLRIVEIKNNSKHRRGVQSNNSSGYRNVSFIRNKWTVQLQIEGKNTILGRFDDVHEVGTFAKEMRNKYYGEFAGN